jgi:hypothetical protein
MRTSASVEFLGVGLTAETRTPILVNHPGMLGDSISWQGWVRWPAGNAGRAGIALWGKLFRTGYDQPITMMRCRRSATAWLTRAVVAGLVKAL